MLRHSFFWRLFAGYTVVILLTAGLVSLIVLGRIEHDYQVDTRNSLQNEARLLVPLCVEALVANPGSQFHSQIDAMGAYTGTRITVIKADGTVIADTDEDPAVMNNHAQRPEMVAALEKGTGTVTRYSQTIGVHFMYLALAVESGRRHVGWVRTAMPLTTFEQRMQDLRVSIGLTALVTILVALFLGYFIAQHISGPLRKMTVVAQAIAAGHYDHRLHVQGSDETISLARALNHMSASLRDRIGTISTERNQLRTVLSGIVEGVIAINADEEIVHMNHAAGMILDVDPEECIGRRTYETLRVNALTEVLKASLVRNEQITSEISMVRQPGDRQLELLAAPLLDGEGDVVGSVVVLHDVTRLRRLEEMRREFVANVSHELKTPLTAIKGITSTLEDDPQMDLQTRTRFLNRISAQADRLEILVSDLLTLSRLESKAETAGHEPLDLRKLAYQVLGEFQIQAGSHEIGLTGNLPDDVITVVGDAVSLRGLLGNLLDNAIKYSSPGNQVRVSLKVEGKWVVLQVKDNGIGIEPEHHERIFERFYRVDKARSRELGGTGLGLSIVKHVAQSHGGSVVLESAPGKGSTFTVRLPVGYHKTTHTA